jgi:hypothetical protein
MENLICQIFLSYLPKDRAFVVRVREIGKTDMASGDIPFDRGSFPAKG